MSKQNGDMAEMQERQMHQGNLGAPAKDTNAPETLKFLAENGDEQEPPVDELKWLSTKSTSTAKFSSEDIRSREWIGEIHKEISTMSYPPVYGISGARRAFVYDDVEEFKAPIDASDRLAVEGYGEQAKESATRSEEGWGTEVATRDTKESIVRDEKESSAGGLWGKIKG